MSAVRTAHIKCNAKIPDVISMGTQLSLMLYKIYNRMQSLALLSAYGRNGAVFTRTKLLPPQRIQKNAQRRKFRITAG